MPEEELVDLHLHTNVSDGTLAPAALVDLAASRGLWAIAVTDHDTTGGHGEALARAAKKGPVVIPGVEISVEGDKETGGAFHLLGYFPRRPGPGEAVEAVLAPIREGRIARNGQILAKLAGLGLPLDEEELAREAGDGTAGRPHIAALMVKHGYVASLAEAFQRYLARGQPAYCERRRLGAREALEMIRGVGGLPVLAHPGVLERIVGAEKLAELVRTFAAWGLAGLEARYPEHGRDQRRRYEELAAAAGLLPTGGTDYHGLNKSGLTIGTGNGDLRVPRAWAEALLERLD